MALSKDVVDSLVGDYPPEVQDLYHKLIAQGQTPAFAEMCATQRSSVMGMGAGNDRIFTEGARAKMTNMDGHNRDKILEQAAKAGVKTGGKYYVSGLGRYTDPRAWVSTADDVLTQCKQRNLNAEGYCNHKASSRPPKKKDMSEDIVDGYIQGILRDEPRTQEKARKGKLTRAELRERVVSEHGK